MPDPPREERHHGEREGDVGDDPEHHADGGADAGADAARRPAAGEELAGDRTDDRAEQQPQRRERQADDGAEQRADHRSAAAAGAPGAQDSRDVLGGPAEDTEHGEHRQPPAAYGREVRGERVHGGADEDQRRAGYERHDGADDARHHQQDDDDVDEVHAGSRWTSGFSRGSVAATTSVTVESASHGYAYVPVDWRRTPKIGGPTSTPLHANATATPVSSPAYRAPPISATSAK